MKKIVMMCVLALALGASGCKKAQDLAKYKEQVTALAAKYAPQLGELGKKLPELLSRAKSLPKGIPGLDKVTALLEENKGKLDQVQGLLSNLPSQLGKDPKAAVENAEKELSTKVGAINESVKSAEAELTEIEAKAKEAPAAGSADAGSAVGSAAGSAAPAPN